MYILHIKEHRLGNSAEVLYLQFIIDMIIIITLKGELQPKIFLLHMKVLTLIKAKSNVFFYTCNAVAARKD